MINQKQVGVFIAEERKNQNYTQKQFAELLGVNSRSVSRWETGRTMPDYALLDDICSLLHVNVSELLAGERNYPSSGN